MSAGVEPASGRKYQAWCHKCNDGLTALRQVDAHIWASVHNRLNHSINMSELVEHKKTDAFGYPACQHCSTAHQGRGDSVLVEWPCPTVANNPGQEPSHEVP